MKLQNIHAFAASRLFQTTNNESACTQITDRRRSRNRDDRRILIVEASDRMESLIRRQHPELLPFLLCVRTANDVYSLVHRCSCLTIVIHPDLPDESGWLVAAKLRLTTPHSRILMFGDAAVEHLEIVGANGIVDAPSLSRVISRILYETESELVHHVF